MRLQIALDCLELTKALHILNIVRPYIDIAEVGSGLAMSEGMEAVRRIKRENPDLCVLADLKIMDGGEYLSSMAYEAGADIVTVLGASADETISGVVKAAKRYGRESFVDMIAVPDIHKRAKEVDDLGIDYICVHTAADRAAYQGAPLTDFVTLTQVVKHAKLAITGGVKFKDIPEIKKLNPSIVIVGSGITAASDMAFEASRISGLLHQHV